jgi:PAS domain S-box-containing protein
MGWQCYDPGVVVARVLRGWCAAAAAVAVLAGVGGLVAGPRLGIDGGISLLLCGAALWALRERATPISPRVRHAADAAAALAAVVAVLDPGGRLSALATLCFVMLAVALLGLDRGRLFRVGQRLAVAAGFMAFVDVIAFVYGATGRASRPAPAFYTDMAPLTALLLVALGIGVTAARPGRGATEIFVQDTAGGLVARRVLPATLVGTVLIGALGLAGLRAGYYGPELGVALMVVAGLSLFSALVWLIAVRLHRTDVRRRQAETELRRINAELEARVAARTAALAASEARYRRLIEESAEGIVIHREGVIRFVNAAALRIFGYTDPGDVVGRPVMEHIAPEHRDAVAARIAARLRGEPTPATVEMEALRRDGTRFWIGGTGAVVEWEGGPATLLSFVDISARHRREAAEREAESLRAVTRLANAAAHEINNPLTVVRGNLQLAAARLTDRPELARYFERAERGVTRITEMIGHMTRITRLASLAGLETGGVPTLDLLGSSAEPAPGADRSGGEPYAP